MCTFVLYHIEIEVSFNFQSKRNTRCGIEYQSSALHNYIRTSYIPLHKLRRQFWRPFRTARPEANIFGYNHGIRTKNGEVAHDKRGQYDRCGRLSGDHITGAR